MFPVEIKISERNDQALTDRMNAMRQWLDHQRFEPSSFRYAFAPPGFVFQVHFKMEAEAVAFATEFGGRAIPVSAEM